MIRALGRALLLVVLVCLARGAGAEGLVTAVGPVGVTVADMDRSVDFYARVLGFEKMSDAEVWGPDYERLQGVFGLRMRVVRMRLGEELFELTEYLAPRGRPIPVDSRSHDRWFQHVAIIVSDMDRAYAWLRAGTRSSTRRPRPSGCPTGTRAPPASARSTSCLRRAAAHHHAPHGRRAGRRAPAIPDPGRRQADSGGRARQ